MTGAGADYADVVARSRERRNRSPLHALRHRTLAIYTAGNFLSNTGTWFQSIASVIVADRLSDGNTIVVGAVVFSQFAAVVLLAPWTGRAADRFDRKRMLLLVQGAAAVASLILAGLEGAGLVTLPVLIGMTLVLGITTAFTVPGLKALVPTLVPPDLTGDAISLDSVTFNLARAIGPVLGAAVYGAFGAAWSFGLNALSYLALIVALLVIRPTPNPRTAGRATLRSAVGLLRGQPMLIASLVVVAAVSVSSDPAATLGPALSRSFGHPSTTAGWLLGAFGAGAVIAGFTLSPGRQHPGRRMVILCSVMAGATLVVAVAPGLGLALPALALAGFGYLASQTQATTALQLGVGESQRGRIMALWSVAFVGTKPLAALIDGALASLVGARAATALMALPVAGAALWVLAAMRKVDAQAALERRRAGGDSAVVAPSPVRG